MDFNLSDDQRNVLDTGTDYPKFTGTLLDDSLIPVAIPSASIVTMTLSVWYINSSGQNVHINNRQNQNVNNNNNVSIDATSGLVSWLVQPQDIAIQQSGLSSEVHYFEFAWTYKDSNNNTRGSHYRDKLNCLAGATLV
jgi:hypothetical protein